MDHRVEVTGRAEPQFPRSEPFPAGITIQVMAGAGIPQSREASPPFPLETNPTERLEHGKDGSHVVLLLSHEQNVPSSSRYLCLIPGSANRCQPPLTRLLDIPITGLLWG